MLRSVRYGLSGAVLAGLIAVPVVWSNLDKTVHLNVDGTTKTVHTTADNVGEVVRQAGYTVTAHDLLAPSAKSGLHDGTDIVLRRGRLLKLSVDGRDVSVWTTAPTVDAALVALGYHASDFVSVSRSTRLPLGKATDIDVRTPATVTVVHDGKQQRTSSTERTVGALFTQLGIKVGPDDRVSSPLGDDLANGETIVVQRVGLRTQTATESVRYSTRHENDDNLTKGKTSVTTTGRTGHSKVVYSLVYIDGKLAMRTKLRTSVLNSPRAEVIAVGTKAIVIPKSTTSSDSGSSSNSGGSSSSGSSSSGSTSTGSLSGSPRDVAKALLAQRGWSDQFSCLDAMWDHESDWDIHADNPGSGAYGIPQSLPGDKMASAGPDWRDNAETQIKWGLSYIADRYNTPCQAWAQWQANGGWY